MTVEEKVAIITGASRGIGRAVAERFARAGARLVLGYRTNDNAMDQVIRSCHEAGAEIVPFKGDIGAPETAEKLVETAMERFSKVDVLINNAAVVREGLVAILEDVELDKMVATNIAGVVRTTRAVLRPMFVQRSGSVVNISSSLASRPARGNAVYAGTKGFVESFTRSVAAEVGSKGIRVNAVAPGMITTDMSAAIRGLAEDRIKKRIALKRFGRAEEVAEVVEFLASDAASYINGAILPVDGGTE